MIKFIIIIIKFIIIIVKFRIIITIVDVYAVYIMLNSLPAFLVLNSFDKLNSVLKFHTSNLV